MKFIYSESVDMPLSIDEASSPTTVYVRNDIQELTKEDEDGAIQTYYKYKEAQCTKEEWAKEKEIKYLLEMDFRLAMVELGLI